ncbi:MAG TPA: hypothetical protein VGW10_12040, partial [Solirubrobacteraceae bacterium]|nr:hypothetical protein [Solirubrobacteraceae bacterium]
MADADTRIELCGELVVRWRGERLEAAFRRRQAKLLLAFLVLNRSRSVRRHEVVAAVWPEEDAPPRADALLAPLLSRMRKALGPEALEGRQELVLRLPEGAVVDWEEMHRGLDEARRRVHAREWRAALEAARTAVAIAEGGLLPGVDAPWLDERRAELADLRVEGLERAAQA